MRRTTGKAGVHRKNKRPLDDTGEIRSSSGKVGGIEGNTRKKRRTRKGRAAIFARLCFS